MKVLENGDAYRIYPNDSYISMPFNLILGKNQYIDIFGTFDIETSNINFHGDTVAIMYVWQFNDGYNTYIGRSWRDFQNFLVDITNTYSLNSNRKFVIYIHNLSFEMQFLRSVLKITNMFATKERNPVRFIGNGVFEFRCSYKMSNMSLSKWSSQNNVPHQKLNGDEFNYNITRYPDTILTEKEIEYCINDVIGLHECIEKELNEGFNLDTIPMTSTGFVRTEAREKVKENPQNHAIFLRSQLNKEEYIFCKSAVRGGDTHANYLYVGEVIEDIYSHDQTSSYPHSMMVYDYPTGKMIKENNPKGLIEGLSNIGIFEFRNIRLKHGVYMPYIPKAKCEHFNKVLNDNGRVVCAEMIIITLTEIDFKIIENQYEWDGMTIHRLYVSDKAPLSKEYREYIMELFVKKCELKGKDEYYYMKSKNKLNSLFGMMLTDITRENVTYENDEWGSRLDDMTVDLIRYYNNKNSFLSYQHGIYVTAYSRMKLQQSYDIIGIDTVYADTDSNKHFGKHEKDFENLNNQLHDLNMSVSIPPICTVDGKVYEMGLWEFDGHYKRFITLGAKKYAYEYDDPKNGYKFGVTVAGLSKVKGADYLERNGLESFVDDAIFDQTYSGRLTPKYDDKIRLETYFYHGHWIEVTSNIALLPTTYTLGRTQEYIDTLKVLKEGF